MGPFFLLVCTTYNKHKMFNFLKSIEMKFINKKLFIGMLIFIGFACDNKEEVNPLPTEPAQQELAAEVQQQISVNAKMDQIRSLGFGAPGGIIGDGKDLPGGRKSNVSSWGRMKRLMGNNTRDNFCVAQAFILNDDGSFVWAIDFGDGCEIDGEYWKGKVIETYHQNEDEKSFKVAIGFENFGNMDWTLEGGAILEGSYDSTSVGFLADYSFVRDLEFTEGEEHWKVQQIGRETLTEAAWTIEDMAANIEYQKVGEDKDIYQNLVAKPLVYKFACEAQNVSTFVSGIDHVRFNDDEATILFGDGECDNIVVVIHNKEYVVDVSTEEVVG